MIHDLYIPEAREEIIRYAQNELHPISKTLPFAERALDESGRYMVITPQTRDYQPSYTRPLLSLAVSDDYEVDRRISVPISLTSELIHALSCGLDDLDCMDGATKRRGRRAAHKQFGDAVTILSAFGLRERVQKIIRQTGLSDRAIVRLSTDLSEITAPDLLQGQVEDLFRKDATLQQILEIHEGKTAALISYALRSGVYAAEDGQSSWRKLIPVKWRYTESYDEDFENLTMIGRILGLWYQINDDILDKVEPEDAGKDTGIDERNIVTASSMDEALELRSGYLSEIGRAFESHPRDLPHLEYVVSRIIESKNVKVPLKRV